MGNSENALRWIGGVALTAALLVGAGIYALGDRRPSPDEGGGSGSEKAVELVLNCAVLGLEDISWPVRGFVWNPQL